MNSAGSTSTSLENRVTGTATLPLFVFLCIIFAIRVATHFSKTLLHALKAILRSLVGRCGSEQANILKDQHSKASAQAVVSYTRAVQRNLIKGLATYNILQNPIYKEAFAITWKFAMENKRVLEVRQMKAKAQASLEEQDVVKVANMQRVLGGKTRSKQFPQPAKKPISKTMQNKGFSGSMYIPPTEEEEDYELNQGFVNNLENKDKKDGKSPRNGPSPKHLDNVGFEDLLG